jgi:GNAT superfamily N-acetyltransferase
MENDVIEIRDEKELPREKVLALYQACRWSAADKPDELLRALAGSHSVISAWKGEELLGLANAISDGALVVYYPHLLVSPSHQQSGIGRRIMQKMNERYGSLHQQVLLAVDDAYGFYQRLGFRDTAGVRPMWVYHGSDM